jgi:hypothetical protein
MLLDKLEQENRATRRRRLLFGAGFAGAAALLGLFVIATVVLWPEPEAGSQQAGQIRADGSPVAAVAGEVVEQTADEPVPAPAGGVAGGDQADDGVAREQAKDLLAAFQQQIEPAIAAPEFAAWDAATQRAVMAAKDAAFEKFSKGQYDAARQEMDAVSTRARDALAARNAAFEDALSAARTAYEADNHTDAEAEVSRAQRLRPDSTQAAALATEVARLPEVLSAISRAAVARVENNADAEEEHLAAALALDPGRRELAIRLDELRAARKERNFAARIDSGLAHVSARRVSQARDDLKAARSLFADRRETRLLSQQIADLSRQLEFENMMASAGSARAADDWTAAETFYARAGAIIPDDPQVTGGYQLAQEINGLQRDLSAVRDTPERLASEAVAARASALVSKARDISELSPALAEQAQQVADLVAAYGTKVSIRILSDGVTRISVRGVGQVGATTDRTIELRPGSYTFEGTRAGYRSKLVEVDIPPGTEGLVLEIYPDEPV